METCQAHTLPPELFHSIFHFYISVLDDFGIVDWENRVIRRSRLRTICRRWADIVDTCPSLWIWISSKDPLRLTRYSLERSGTQPLSILYDWKHYNARAFMDLAAPHINRWGDVVILSAGDALAVDLTPLRTTPAPLLRAIMINFHLDYSLSNPLINPPITIFGDEAPQLTKVSLFNIRTPLTSHVLRGLEDFSWTDQRTAEPIALADLVCFLENSPGIQGLYLNWTQCRETEPLSHAPITLPRLTRIHLDQFSTIVALTILRFIVAPACNDFLLSVSVWHGRHRLEAELYEPLTGFLPWLFELPESELVIIDFSDYRFNKGPSLKVESLRGTFNLVSPRGTTDAMLRWMATIAGQCSSRDIETSLTLDDSPLLDNSSALRLLFSLPKIAFLNLGYDGDRLRVRTWFLASELDRASFLPALHHLQIGQKETIDRQSLFLPIAQFK